MTLSKITQQKNLHQKAFLLGRCLTRGDRVEWSEEGGDETAARDRFQFLQPEWSIVLFEQITKQAKERTSTTELTPILVSGLHGTDVAVILEAARIRVSSSSTNRSNGSDSATEDSTITTMVDRSKVEKQIQEGDAPFLPPSRSKLQQFLLKRSMESVFWRPTVEYFAAGPHRWASLCYFNVQQHPAVQGHVALTLDDAPCRLKTISPSPLTKNSASRMDEIRSLLAKYNAKATFMLVGKFIRGNEDSLVRLLQDGHEFGNHGGLDQAHDTMTDEEFLAAVDDCTNQIQNLHRQAGTDAVKDGKGMVKYFRAPHGKYTKRMEELIHSRDMVNVMCDAYASDPAVEDADYIAQSLTRQARDGGIILLHVPERGFREHCLTALEQLLESLKQRDLKFVTVGMLEALAKSS